MLNQKCLVRCYPLPEAMVVTWHERKGMITLVFSIPRYLDMDICFEIFSFTCFEQMQKVNRERTIGMW